mgnify:CR=1 FL=1
MVMFDSTALIINPAPYEFGEGLLPPTTFVRTKDDQPSPEDSLEWYASDPSDPADWDAEDEAFEQALLEDARACGLID